MTFDKLDDFVNQIIKPIMPSINNYLEFNYGYLLKIRKIKSMIKGNSRYKVSIYNPKDLKSNESFIYFEIVNKVDENYKSYDWVIMIRVPVFYNRDTKLSIRVSSAGGLFVGRDFGNMSLEEITDSVLFQIFERFFRKGYYYKYKHFLFISNNPEYLFGEVVF